MKKNNRFSQLKNIKLRNMILIFFSIVFGFGAVYTMANVEIQTNLTNSIQIIKQIIIEEIGSTNKLFSFNEGGTTKIKLYTGNLSRSGANTLADVNQVIGINNAGEFMFIPPGLVGSGGGSGGGTGDNLGNHIATQNINLGTRRLSPDASNQGISFPLPNQVKLSSLVGIGDRCVYAQADGVLMASSNNCNTGTGGGTGDNLGNHIATQNITLGNNRINYSTGDGNKGIKLSNGPHNVTISPGSLTLAYLSGVGQRCVQVTSGGILAATGCTSTGFADNLGNHTAIANIKLNSYRLSNDGGNEGINVADDGLVGVNSNPVSPFSLYINGYTNISGNLYSKNSNTSGLTNTNSLTINGLANSGTKCLHVNNNGEVGLTTTDCSAGTGGSPGGSNTHIQFNDNGSFSGTNNLVRSNNRLGIGLTGPNNTIQVKDLINFDNINTSTFVGYQAGKLNNAGGNTAIGNQSFKSNINGNNNTAIGVVSLSSNTGGTSNIAIGSAPLYSNTVGNENIAIGQNTLYENINGYNNVAIGQEALFVNIAGYYNTAIGEFAGHSSIGSSNVFLGYRAGYNETGSNKLHIANIDTKTLIYGDFQSNRVGINTTNPSEALDVLGKIKSSSLSGASNRCVYVDPNGVLTAYATDCGTGVGGTGDNLGNHTATTGLKLNGNRLTNDGDSEGVRIDNTGNIIFSQDTISGSGTRLMRIPAKQALRAGYVNGSQRDNTNIGTGSIAFGTNNKVTGIESSIVGGYTNEINPGAHSIIGGGTYNFIGLTNFGVIGGGTYNSLTGYESTIGGGSHNSINVGYQCTIAGGEYNSITYGDSNTIGGGSNNYIISGSNSSTIAGGELNYINGGQSSIVGGYQNTLTGDYSFIGGGNNNRINNNSSNTNHEFIGGGSGNYLVDSLGSFIGNGFSNQIIESRYASIVGGLNNYMSTSSYSSIVGGEGNYIRGYHSIIGGGQENFIVGNFSYAGGYMAKNMSNNTFLRNGDNSNAFTASVDNTFIVNAPGGFGIGTDKPTATLDISGSMLAKSSGFVLGNFGVGTTSPETKFSVMGNGYISDNALIGSRLFVGYGAAERYNNNNHVDVFNSNKLVVKGGANIIGNIKVAQSNTTCSPSHAGEIKYNGGCFQGCNGTTRIALANTGCDGGVCGYYHGQDYYSLTGGITNSGHCTAGSLTGFSNNNTTNGEENWARGCYIAGKTTASCYANKSINGACGGTVYSCTSGEPNAYSCYGSMAFRNCDGYNSGSIASCSTGYACNSF